MVCESCCDLARFKIPIDNAEPNGRYALTVGRDQRVAVLDLSTLSVRRDIEIGEQIEDADVRWDADTHAFECILALANGTIWILRISPDDITRR